MNPMKPQQVYEAYEARIASQALMTLIDWWPSKAYAMPNAPQISSHACMPWRQCICCIALSLLGKRYLHGYRQADSVLCKAEKCENCAGGQAYIVFSEDETHRWGSPMTCSGCASRHVMPCRHRQCPDDRAAISWRVASRHQNNEPPVAVDAHRG